MDGILEDQNWGTYQTNQRFRFSFAAFVAQSMDM